MLGYSTLLYSMSDFSASIELSKTHAAAISAFLNLGTAAGRPLNGFISDRYGRIQVAGLCTFICGFCVLPFGSSENLRVLDDKLPKS